MSCARGGLATGVLGAGVGVGVGDGFGFGRVALSLWAAVEPGKSVVSVEAVVTDGENAVIFAAFDHVAVPTGRPFNTDVALRLTVTDGKITRMHLFEDTAAVAAAYTA